MLFGEFITAVPRSAFIALHIAFAIAGLALWRRARRCGNGAVARGFLLFVVAELCYLTYHLDWTAFLFAHTLGEVADLLAFLSVGMGIRPSRAA